MAAVHPSDARADQKKTTARRPGSKKKPVSARRAESNRRNAQKSTGPRTEAGKCAAGTMHQARHDRRVDAAAGRECR